MDVLAIHRSGQSGPDQTDRRINGLTKPPTESPQRKTDEQLMQNHMALLQRG